MTDRSDPGPEVEALIARDREMLRGKITSETAKIPWRELQRFFAAGKVMRVDPGLDLVEVAAAMQQDEVNRVQGWIAGAELAPVDDSQARAWFEADSLLWAVVVKPWVLVQQREAAGDGD